MISATEACEIFNKKYPRYSIKAVYESNDYFHIHTNEKRLGGVISVSKEGEIKELNPFDDENMQILDSAKKITIL